MDQRKLQIIRISIVLVTVAALVGANVYTIFQLRKHADVINRQGAILKVIIETPEINAVITKELQRRQAEPQK